MKRLYFLILLFGFSLAQTSDAAFGDLVKSARQFANVTTFTADLGSNPTSGNLLIFTAGAGSGSASVSTPPSGFTEIESAAGGGAWYWYWKLSDGTEQTAAITWGAGTFGVVNYVEYEWDGSTPSVQSTEDVTNVSTATNSQSSGAQTPSGSTNIVLFVHGTDGNSNSFTGQAVDGTCVEDLLFGSNGGSYAEVKVCRLVSVTGSQSATHTDTDTGDQMWGSVAVFNVAGGSPVPIIIQQH